MPKLQVIIASTRPGRVGLPVGQWFYDRAVKHGGFEVELIDLAEVNLPFMDEPHHPRLARYEHQHTKDWSAKIESGDAFVFVMPEYNFGITAPLKNAIDYLNREWAHKPLALVSYGGVSAGLRAAQQVRQIVAALKMMVLPEAVSIPFVAQFLNDNGEIQANEVMETSVTVVLDELVRWTDALKVLRT
jgi:NAD(P)H-dependent FMN reductase